MMVVEMNCCAQVAMMINANVNESNISCDTQDEVMSRRGQRDSDD